MNVKEVLGAFLLVNNTIVLSEEETKDVQKAIKQLQQENKKYKEVIDKLKTNIENDIDCFRTINEFGESNKILELLDIYLDILKEVKTC